jgi:DNA polymerase-3 subunit epsilon
MRQIVLDTETTGLETSLGHRIIEIGCVEVVNRRLTGNHYHQYINPEREIDSGAFEVHGISNQFLADKPVFASVVDEFMAFIDGAELVIHNAPFDVGFINHELRLNASKFRRVEDYCGVIDTLAMARQKHPGQRVTLDALCKRYAVDNSARTLHGALLDAEILADVYLLMTGGQTNLFGGNSNSDDDDQEEGGHYARHAQLFANRRPGLIITPSDEELAQHEMRLDAIEKASGGQCLFRNKSS